MFGGLQKGEKSLLCIEDTPPIYLHMHFLQYTVEKLGKADSVTEIDTELEDLSRQLENIRLSAEKILVQVQSLVVPNPSEPADIHTPMHNTKAHAHTHTYLPRFRQPH